MPEMDRESANEYVRSQLRAYIEQITKKSKGTNFYDCPFCGSGTGKHKTGALSIKDISGVPKATCFAQHCVSCADTFDLIAKYESLSAGEAFKRGYEIFGITIVGEAGTVRRATGRPSSAAVAFSPAAQNVQVVEPERKNYTTYLSECKARVSQTDYLREIRGLTPETISRFNLGLDLNYSAISKKGKPYFLGKAITIPYNRRNDYFTVRLLEKPEWYTKDYAKPPAEEAGEEPIFNLEAIYNNEGQPVFITEAAFCAMSVEQEGGRAAALGGTGYQKLLSLLRQRPTTNVLVLCLDNDEAGRSTTKRLAAGLKELNISYRVKNICGEKKDPNEALVYDRKSFVAAIEAVIAEIEQDRTAEKRPDAVLKYLNETFLADIDRFKSFKDKKTGFTNLDIEMGGLYAGFYVVGGISSVGKTTFIHQLADQLAERGEHILYFSLEQSILELSSKSLARLAAQMDRENAISSLSIRCGQITPLVKKAINKYAAAAGRVSIIQGDFDTTVEVIGEYIGRYIQNNRVKPIVFVDYLQIIQTDLNSTKKDKIDLVVTELKRISRRYDIALIVISSLNRSNYLTPIDFESFKESGGIEYTADVVWGLQLQAIHDPIFEKEGSIGKKRELIKKAKGEIPRKIELSCLKNRNGRPSFSCGYIYYPQFDLFQEDQFFDELGYSSPGNRY